MPPLGWTVSCEGVAGADVLLRRAVSGQAGSNAMLMRWRVGQAGGAQRSGEASDARRKSS